MVAILKSDCLSATPTIGQISDGPTAKNLTKDIS